MADITVRRMRFEWPDDLGVLPRPDDPVASCELVAFSLTLPHLEPYLIRTMRDAIAAAAAREGVDEALIADMRHFSSQEAHHHRNHARINEILRAQLSAAAAAEVLAIEAGLEEDYRRFSSSRSLRFNLAYAEGFEAMTLQLALLLLEQGLDDVDPDWAGLIEWHLAEEIEHRTVTFDAYARVAGGYAYRVAVGSWAQAHFLGHVFALAAAVHRDVVPEASSDPWRSTVRSYRRQWQSGLMPATLRALSPRYDPARVRIPDTVAALLAKYDELAA